MKALNTNEQMLTCAALTGGHQLQHRAQVNAGPGVCVQPPPSAAGHLQGPQPAPRWGPMERLQSLTNKGAGAEEGAELHEQVTVRWVSLQHC